MLSVLSIYDSKAKAFIQPFFAPNNDVGVRMFSQAASDPETQFNKFPADFTLFDLGTFDPQTGKHDLHATPVSLGLASIFAHTKVTTPHIVDAHYPPHVIAQRDDTTTQRDEDRLIGGK